MTTKTRAVRTIVRLGLLYLLTSVFFVLTSGTVFLRYQSTFWFMLLSLMLLLYFSERIIDPAIRRLLMAVASLMTFWIVLRGAKYIAFTETELIARHLWYLYYVPILLIPLLSFFTALYVSGRRGKSFLIPVCSSSCFTAVLLLLIQTNDRHQLAFRFRPGFADWDGTYVRGPVFILACLWIAVLVLAMFRILFIHCRLSASRRLIWVPLLPAFFGSFYSIIYAFGLWPQINGDLIGEFPESVCFSIAGVWMGLIRIGLIPCNHGYGRLFEISDLAAQIADRSGRVIYRSATAQALAPEQMKSITTVSLDEDTRLHRRPVQGGFVYWQDDVSELNRINRRLEELGEQLNEETSFYRLENALQEERAQIEEKDRVYDAIAARVLPQSREIARLCREAGEDESRFAPCMEQVCLLASYIKRCADLCLLAAHEPAVSGAELQLALHESLMHLREKGIPTSERSVSPAMLHGGSVVEAYILFETLLEQALPGLKGVQTSLEGDRLRIALEGAEIRLPYGCLADLTTEDGSSYVTLTLERAGEPS